jgi:hypothetical protein
MNERANDNQRTRAAGLDGRQRIPQASDELTYVLEQQIRRWPLATVGAAIVAGYLLGRHDTSPAARNARNMRASAWITSANTQSGGAIAGQYGPEQNHGRRVPVADAQDTIWHASGSASSSQASDTTVERQGPVLSEAPNASFDSGAGSGTTGFDSPPIASSYLSNTDVGGPDEGRPYFPPGGAPDRDRSGQEQGGDHS